MYTGHSCIELLLFIPLKNLTVQVTSGYVRLPQSTLASVSLKSHSSHAMLWCWTKYWDVSDGQWKHVDSLGQVGPREVTMKLYIHTYISIWIYHIPHKLMGKNSGVCQNPKVYDWNPSCFVLSPIVRCFNSIKIHDAVKSAKIPWEIQAFPSKTMKLH